jgi:transcriptional regulator with XRE-family HTH domain
VEVEVSLTPNSFNQRIWVRQEVDSNFFGKFFGRKFFLVLRSTAKGYIKRAVTVKQKAKPRISFLREKAGLTQLELSRLVGVTESTIQNWESGRTGTEHIERVIRFCRALNCQVDDLIEYTSDSEEPAAKPSSLDEVRNLLGTEESSPTYSPNLETSQERQHTSNSKVT